jgi:hypothetical protein
MLSKCYANSESFPYPIGQGYLNGSKYETTPLYHTKSSKRSFRSKSFLICNSQDTHYPKTENKKSFENIATLFNLSTCFYGKE